MTVARQLIETGKVTRAFLGVSLDSHFGPAMAAELGLPSPMGTRVLGVTQGSPAEAARLQAGDVILQIDGVRVEDDAHLINLVSLIEVGKTVPLVIFRDGKTLTVSVERGRSQQLRPQPVSRGRGRGSGDLGIWGFRDWEKAPRLRRGGGRRELRAAPPPPSAFRLPPSAFPLPPSASSSRLRCSVQITTPCGSTFALASSHCAQRPTSQPALFSENCLTFWRNGIH